MAIRSIDDIEVAGKRVLLRVDINSPMDPATGRIAEADRGARLVIIAHQGDTLDYPNLVGISEHAERLADKLGRPVEFIDDVAGPAARNLIESIGDGGILLLDNLRYLTEEVSTFERDVKLTPDEMARTYLVRNLAPLFDFYINDAFAAAHRASPSMIGFQSLLPSAAGRLLEAEVAAITGLTENPRRPLVFLLGGLKVSDGFSMMGRVLADGLADRVLTSGVLGEIFLAAGGVALGDATDRFIAERDLTRYVEVAAELLADYPDRIAVPSDVAVVVGGQRSELQVADLPTDHLITDLGEQTITSYESEVAAAGTVFVNGPAGAYEQEGSDVGTRRMWAAVAATGATSLIGGGDTVASARKFVDTAKIDHVSTGGGALIRFVSGQPLPLLESFEA